ncbi:MAG: serine/threonine-protein kinase [Planctomycetota bacterium]
MASDGSAQNGQQSPRDPVTPRLPSPDVFGVPPATPNLPNQPPPELPRRSLGQYTVLEKIGEGGMGLVFKAFDTALERTVALKVLVSSPVDDPKHAERFVREARSLARLSHPNLLPVYNVGREGECYYFTMELLAGETLSSVLRRRGRLPAAELLPYLGQILSALHYIHLQGITHRDVKSANIMLCPHRAVLMDFGLAKDETYSGLTTIGAVLGTPGYMSPEVAQGTAAGPPTDLYSIGVVMYEALTGRLPFIGASALSIIRQHIDLPPPPIEGEVPAIDSQLAVIVHKCLAKRPAERYPHCPALAAELVKLQTTPELATLAVEQPDFSVRPSQKRTAGSLALPAGTTAAATLAGSGAVLRPTSGSNETAPTVVAQSVGPPSPLQAGSRQAGTPPAGQTVSLPSAKSKAGLRPALQRWQTWAWMAAGFFGVLLLAFLVGRPKPPPGQPAWLHKADGSTEEIRWVEFKANDTDSSKWKHVIQRKRPDGAWEPETISHQDFVRNVTTLQFQERADGAQKKQ